MKRVRFHPDARAELLGAIRFYQNETAGLGRAMAGEVRSALLRISEFPESGSPDGTPDDLRRVFLDRFPFTLGTEFRMTAWKFWQSCISGSGPTIGALGSSRRVAEGVR